MDPMRSAYESGGRSLAASSYFYASFAFAGLPLASHETQEFRENNGNNGWQQRRHPDFWRALLDLRRCTFIIYSQVKISLREWLLKSCR
jgi:hypothetical protein